MSLCPSGTKANSHNKFKDNASNSLGTVFFIQCSIRIGCTSLVLPSFPFPLDIRTAGEGVDISFDVFVPAPKYLRRTKTLSVHIYIYFENIYIFLFEMPACLRKTSNYSTLSLQSSSNLCKTSLELYTAIVSLTAAGGGLKLIG